MNTKERTLGIRLGDLTDLVSSFESTTGLSAGTVAKELLSSVLFRWQKDNELKWPMVAVPKKEYEELCSIHGLNEKGSGYQAKNPTKGKINVRNAAAPLPTYLVLRKAHILEPITKAATASPTATAAGPS